MENQLLIAEHVPYPIDRLYEPRFIGISFDLAPEVGDMGVHRPIEAIEVVPEDSVYYLVPGEGPTSVAHQQY